MKQIYSFEHSTPPILNEAMLRETLEKRRLQKQTALLAVAGILLQLVFLIYGLLTFQTEPQISMLCFGYIFISLVGSAFIVLAYIRKGGFAL